jgi:hypothetical protein
MLHVLPQLRAADVFFSLHGADMVNAFALHSGQR